MMLLTQKLIRSLNVLIVFAVLCSSALAVAETSDATGQTNPTEIQKALTEAGFYKGDIDGVVGTKTKAAIRKFQEANDLKVDGVVGPKTWEKLKAYLEEAKEIDDAATQTPAVDELTQAAPALDETDSDDYGYSEYDTTGSDENDELKQKLVS